MLRDATTHVLAAIMVNVATTSNTTTAPINQQDFFFANETNLESMSDNDGYQDTPRRWVSKKKDCEGG